MKLETLEKPKKDRKREKIERNFNFEERGIEINKKEKENNEENAIRKKKERKRKVWGITKKERLKKYKIR